MVTELSDSIKVKLVFHLKVNYYSLTKKDTILTGVEMVTMDDVQIFLVRKDTLIVHDEIRASFRDQWLEIKALAVVIKAYLVFTPGPIMLKDFKGWLYGGWLKARPDIELYGEEFINQFKDLGKEVWQRWRKKEK